MKDETDKGYYRCKIKYQTLYEEFTNAIGKYITPSMLSMLQHDVSTQKNESLNHYVATLVPKDKEYSISVSLKTRVMLNAGSQIVGHLLLWTRIFTNFNLKTDQNLI